MPWKAGDEETHQLMMALKTAAMPWTRADRTAPIPLMMACRGMSQISLFP